MKKSTIIKLIVVLLALAAVVVCATTVQSTVTSLPCEACEGAGCDDCGSLGSVPVETKYYATFVSLLPPIIAIILALVTKEVYSSMLITLNTPL